MRRRLSRRLAACASVATVTASAVASASPQANAGLTLGVAGVGTRDAPWSATRFALGTRADVLLLRERDVDAGFGPYVEGLTTASFHDVQVGGGASFLIPVHPYLPIVLSAGPYARWSHDTAWEPGAAVSLFWGSRSYNYHAPYGLAAGLWLDARYGLGPSHETAFVAGVQIDWVILALPILLGIDALRHS